MTDEAKTIPVPENAQSPDLIQNVPTPETPEAMLKRIKDLEDERTQWVPALKTANGEAAERRKKLEAYEKADEERKAASLSELEKEKKRADDAEAREKAADARSKETSLRAAFENAAYKAGVAHPEDVYKLADQSAVSVDEDGKITGVTEAVKAVVDAGRVTMSASGPPPAPNLDGGAGSSHSTSRQTRLTSEEIEIARRMKMTPAAYAAQKTNQTAATDLIVVGPDGLPVKDDVRAAV